MKSFVKGKTQAPLAQPPMHVIEDSDSEGSDIPQPKKNQSTGKPVPQPQIAKGQPPKKADPEDSRPQKDKKGVSPAAGKTAPPQVQPIVKTRKMSRQSMDEDSLEIQPVKIIKKEPADKKVVAPPAVNNPRKYSKDSVDSQAKVAPPAVRKLSKSSADLEEEKPSNKGKPSALAHISKPVSKHAKPPVDSEESSENIETQKKVQPKQVAPLKPAPKPIQKSKEPSDSSSEEEQKVVAKSKGKPAPVAPPKKGAKNVQSEQSDSEESEEPPQPKAKIPAKVTAPVGKPAQPIKGKAPVKQQSEDDQDEQSEEEVKPVHKNAKQAVKGRSPPKKIASDQEDDEEDEQPVKKGPKKEDKKPTKQNAGKQPETNEEEQIFEVYVGKLPYSCVEEELREFFAECGDIKRIKMLMSPEGGFRGIAFIGFGTEAQAENAVSYNGSEFGRMNIKVERSVKKNKDNQDKKQPFKKEFGGASRDLGIASQEVAADSTTVFVGNLSFNCDKSQLQSVFQEIDGFRTVRIITDRDTGKPKGFGYVEFEDCNGVKEALKLNGVEVQGRGIRINLAENKRNDAGFGGGARRGGDRGGFGGGRGGWSDRGGRGDRGGFGGGRGGFGGGRGGGDFAKKGFKQEFQGSMEEL